MPTFSPPLRTDWTFAQGSRQAPRERQFWAHFGAQPRGNTILRTGGVYTMVSNPTQTQLMSCDLVTWPDGSRSPEYYLGGHVYEVTDAVGLVLVGAGYTVTFSSGYSGGYAGGY